MPVNPTTHPHYNSPRQWAVWCDHRDGMSHDELKRKYGFKDSRLSVILSHFYRQLNKHTRIEKTPLRIYLNTPQGLIEAGH